MQDFSREDRPAALNAAGMKRRDVIGFVAAAAVVSATELSPGTAVAADDTVKIGAVLPLAGAFAASGQDMLHGAELAVAEINAAGGIKSLGGRKIELVSGDAGQSPETAVTTARRVLNMQPVACIGSWYSSLTLAATQVAEQRKIPWLTGSIADAIVGRGFKYVFQISAGSEDSAQGLIDAIKKVSSGTARLGLLTDNNAANVDVKAFIKKKITTPIVSEQTWTPPLADATPVVSAAMREKPTVIYLGATSTSDQVLVLKQLAAQGNTAPILMGASSAANPIFLDAVGAKAMEGVVVITGVSFPGKGTEEVNRKYAAATKQAFMDCEAFTGYVNINIIAQALEKSGKAEPGAVRLALSELDARNVPALAVLPNGARLRFGPNGRRIGTVVELVQWQGGQPRVVYPEDVAVATLKTKI
jgi:branched-chain amino acid transport system substrate-binding protein